ncbi:ThuA domain-containing protein [Novosphingobium sp. BL-8A]|uniref:ThuA domain-containing protein n=1 Tax=Novosphingobium sp. BL-8A TaxID=3127639 RepID=UPI003757461F
MARKILRGILIVVGLLLAVLAIQAFRYRDTIQRVFLGGVKVYETQPPQLPANLPRPAILVFSKTNAFRHADAIAAANSLFQQIAHDKGWGYFQTENGAAFRPDILSRFDAVVFNNVSGDVFTPDQRLAFEAFVKNGGGFLGLHAAGDNSHEAWPWYADNLIGATFTMHTMSPQFQTATVNLEDRASPVLAGLPPSWKHNEEWYSFAASPRLKGYHVLMTVDERTYNPEGMFGKDLRMGTDHPVVWWHCVGKGRALYSALGHQPEAFRQAEYVRLLTNAVSWTARQTGSECGDAKALP